MCIKSWLIQISKFVLPNDLSTIVTCIENQKKQRKEKSNYSNLFLMKYFIFCTLFINGLVFTSSAQCDPLKIVVLGSSTSYGTGASHQDSSYVGRYFRFLADSVNKDCVIYNLALSGYTSYQM